MEKKRNYATWIQTVSRIKADDIYKNIEEDAETSFETSCYLIDDGSEGKKARGTKNYVIQRKFKFQDNKNC